MPRRVNTLRVNYKAVFHGKNSNVLLGQVDKIHEQDGSRRVKCLRLSLDPKLLKYWNVEKRYWACDDRKMNTSSYIGDIVLIKQLMTPISQYVTHRVTEVIYKNGAVIDPLTGRLCAGIRYADDIQNSKLDKYLQTQKEKLSTEV